MNVSARRLPHDISQAGGWKRHSASAGIALLECVVYIGAFFVVLSLAFMALDRTWKTHFLLERSAQDIAMTLHAGEQWRGDIRNATGLVEVTSAPGEWRVRIPTARGLIVYELANGQLYRQIEGRSGSAILSNVRESKMFADPRQQVTAWRWELELKTRSPKARLHPLFTFMAVPNAPGRL